MSELWEGEPGAPITWWWLDVHVSVSPRLSPVAGSPEVHLSTSLRKSTVLRVWLVDTCESVRRLTDSLPPTACLSRLWSPFRMAACSPSPSPSRTDSLPRCAADESGASTPWPATVPKPPSTGPAARWEHLHSITHAFPSADWNRRAAP